MSYYPTKEQIEYDYFILNLTQNDLALKYGFETRQVIHRLFKKYNIIPKSKKEISSIVINRIKNKPPKNILNDLYRENSITKISKILNVSRGLVSKLIDEYSIEKTYFKNIIDNDLLLKESKNLSVKEISAKYSIGVSEIKRRLKGKIVKKQYEKNKLIKIFSLYDINSKHFAIRIKNDDINVYESILNITKEHKLNSNKITEKIYRIINNVNYDKEYNCKKCNTKLNFYSLSEGYTKSNLCKNCITCLTGASKISQELFWKLYKILNNPDKCYFAELNYEKSIKITSKDRKKFNNFNKLNKYNYFVDFMNDNKIIEYDGEYWHLDKEKDLIKDNFLKYKGYKILRISDKQYKNNKEKVLNDCIEFLRE